MNKLECAEVFAALRRADEVARQFIDSPQMTGGDAVRAGCGKAIREITQALVEKHAEPLPAWKNPKDAV